MRKLYEHSTGGFHFTISQIAVGRKDKALWRAAKGETLLIDGSSAEDVLAKLKETGFTVRERLPEFLYEWREVRF